MAYINIILAQDLGGAIGKGNTIPWRVPSDLCRFKRLTMDGIVVMGRKTYESIGKPLPKRKNIVLTRKQIDGVETYSSAKSIFAEYATSTIWVIGGSMVYKRFWQFADEIHRTIVHTHIEGADAFAPAIDTDKYELVHKESCKDLKDEFSSIYEIWKRK